MKQILDGCCLLLTYLWLWQSQINQCWFLDLSLWVQAESVFWLVSLLLMDGTHQIHTNHDSGIQCQILLFWVGSTHISYALSLSFNILDKWNINNQCSTSCVRPGYVMYPWYSFLFLFVLFCPGWSKYSWFQDINDYFLSQWLRNVDLVSFLCSKEDHTLQYVVLSNEVELSPFLLILVPWILLAHWRSRQYELELWIWYYRCCCFLILREVSTLLTLESSGYQFQDGIRHPLRHFSFLGDTQMLLHILQEVKASAKRVLKRSI
jgi:hypothetical protein